MPRVPWHTFKHRYPQAHLVAASVRAAQLVGSPDLKAAQTTLERFVKTLAPVGDYATTIVRDTGRPEVYLAFADERDARILADAVDAVDARVSHGDAGWASERAFRLDGASLRAIASRLPPRKPRPPSAH
jgi:hypothetical protein